MLVMVLFLLLKAKLLVWEQLVIPLEGLVELGYASYFYVDPEPMVWCLIVQQETRGLLVLVMVLFLLLKAELLVWEQLVIPLEGLVELGYFPTEELVIV